MIQFENKMTKIHKLCIKLILNMSALGFITLF